MPELTHLSLFSGIGGLDLAAEWAGFRTVGQCEWADYPRAVLEKHWPGLPRWRDIRTLTKESFYEQTGLHTVDAVSGGFPCQPFSQAGKRRGKEDDRYLWPEFIRVIRELRPTWVIGENVPGIINLALDTVLADLEAEGYEVQCFLIPACGVDAPHRRERIAIVANANSKGQQRAQQYRTPDARGQEEPHRPAGKQSDYVANSHADGCTRAGVQSEKRCNSYEKHFVKSESGYVSNTDCTGLQIPRSESRIKEVYAKNGTPQCGGWPSEPNVGRVAHGVPNRVDRLKCLGNAVVPQQFYPIFEAIARVEEMTWVNPE